MWDARAQEIARPEKYLNNPLRKRRLEDYFDFPRGCETGAEYKETAG